MNLLSQLETKRREARVRKMRLDQQDLDRERTWLSKRATIYNPTENLRRVLGL